MSGIKMADDYFYLKIFNNILEKNKDFISVKIISEFP